MFVKLINRLFVGGDFQQYKSKTFVFSVGSFKQRMKLQGCLLLWFLASCGPSWASELTPDYFGDLIADKYLHFLQT